VLPALQQFFSSALQQFILSCCLDRVTRAVLISCAALLQQIFPSFHCLLQQSFLEFVFVAFCNNQLCSFPLTQITIFLSTLSPYAHYATMCVILPCVLLSSLLHYPCQCAIFSYNIDPYFRSLRMPHKNSPPGYHLFLIRVLTYHYSPRDISGHSIARYIFFRNIARYFLLQHRAIFSFTTSRDILITLASFRMISRAS
jgi:hypothetical protein